MGLENTVDSKQVEFNDQEFESLDSDSGSLDKKEFHSCLFINARLSGARLVGSKFFDCTFRGCDLSNIVVKGSSFHSVRFEDSKMIGINWTEAKSIKHPKFLRSILSFTNMGGLDLRKATFDTCIIREAEFTQSNLSEANCQGTDFSGTRFLNTNMAKADFRGAQNYAIRPNDNNLKQAIFSLPEATLLLHGLDIILEE